MKKQLDIEEDRRLLEYIKNEDQIREDIQKQKKIEQRIKNINNSNYLILQKRKDLNQENKMDKVFVYLTKQREIDLNRKVISEYIHSK